MCLLIGLVTISPLEPRRNKRQRERRREDRAFQHALNLGHGDQPHDSEVHREDVGRRGVVQMEGDGFQGEVRRLAFQRET